MIRVLALVFLGFASVLSVRGQVFPHNTMFNYNRFTYNPAVAGSTEGTTITLLSRQQWLGMPGGPQWYNISAHTPVKALGGGLGANVMADRIGPYAIVTANAAYAVNLKFGADEQFRLNFGVNGGIKQANINADFIYDKTVLDPLLPDGKLVTSSNLMPNLGAGIHFAVRDMYAEGNPERFFLGISGQDLTEPVMKGIFGSSEATRINRTFFAYTGYRIDLSEKASVTPMAFLRTDLTPGLNNLPFQLDLGATFNLQPVVLAMSYRWQDAITATVGADITSNLFLGYAYDYTLSTLNVGGYVQSHELVLNYTIPTRAKAIRNEGDPLNSRHDDQ
jgi:type IX secretion system PorP/SprF family membrane protein